MVSLDYICYLIELEKLLDVDISNNQALYTFESYIVKWYPPPKA